MFSKKKLSFIQMLLMIGLIPLLLVAIISTVYAVLTLEKHLEENVYEKLEIACEGMEEYFSYDIINNGAVDHEEYSDYAYMDMMKDNDDIELTLFQGDVRFLTSLKNEDNTRNEGTQANPDIWAKVQAGEHYMADHVKIGKSEYYVYYMPVYADKENTQIWGMAFAGMPEEHVKKSISSVVGAMTGLAIVLVIIFAAIIVVLALKLRNIMKESVDALQVLAEGNISKPITVNAPIAELNDIADASKLLQTNLKDSISGVKETADQLSQAVAEVSMLCETNSTSSIQVDEAVQELAKATESMAQSVESTNTQTITMGNDIERIAENVTGLAASSENIRMANNDASSYIESVYESSNKSVQAVEAISRQIKDTNEAINNVNDVVATIMEIASQTNLLALNASIEAARAGEAGRGFAVVADEIGKLAQQSSDGASQISELANRMIAMSTQSVQHAEEITKIILNEQESVKKAQDKFQVLAGGVQSSIEGISEVSGQSDSLAMVKDGITANISDLSSISEENGAMAEEISASITQMTDAISSTMGKAQEMQAMSEHLMGLVEYFK